MALRDPHDIITLQTKDEPGIVIRHIDAFGLPEDPRKNIAGVALQSFIDAMGTRQGFEMIIEKKIKPGSGIGSSAASAAGAVVAANELLGRPFDKKALLSFAMDGEVLASGSRHADNLAPCIFGGLVLIRDTESLDIVPLASPELYVTIVHPQIEIKTSYAREILPKEIALKSAVTQWANVAGLVSGFLKNDYELISRSLQDVIVEPVRCKLIPGFNEVKERSMNAGAMGGGISGSGPSLFMFSQNKTVAEKIAQEMNAVYEKLEIESKTYVTGLSEAGVRIINDHK
jgi:homoserine kinase